MSKTYFPREHYYTSDETRVVWVQDDATGKKKPLPFAGKKARHSPTGYAWGYGGSGPAELARAILADHMGKLPHPALYQDFKFKFIAALPQDSVTWTISSDTIAAWLVEQEKKGTPMEELVL